jgi:FlaA1/EpsC-like NDP-sugar epimerase
MTPFVRTFQKTRLVTLALVYCAVLSLCYYLSYEIRFDFQVPPDFQHERLRSLGIILLVKLLFLLVFRQFGSLLTYFSVPDLVRIAAATACANLTVYMVRSGLSPEHILPRGVVLTDFVLSVGALASLRLGLRIYRERYLERSAPIKGKVRRIAILGAGDAGAQFVREIQSRPALGLRPVFFLDDDRSKHGHEIHTVPVLGAPEQIGQIREDHAIDSCVLAMPSASGKRLQEIHRVLSAEDLKVEIIPSLSELATGRIQISKIRPVQVEDLLGRASVDLRSPEVQKMVQGKVVLVTGAGGSIGSELCRQIAGYTPHSLLLVEQCEGALFNIESELNQLGHQHTIIPLVADILDEGRMQHIIRTYSPQIIFHAAAHKHVYMMERQPGEAVKNNTTGTRLLAQLAVANHVETFVLISTDKAINPTSAMGASKRLAERHLQAIQAGNPDGTRFIAVRFGNVLGSSGSVIPIFKKQIAEGGPVTVTHPDVTRFFMTIPEAVGLVLQTAVMGKGGEIFVLDMGQPVKIIDLARQLIEFSGLTPDVDIEIKIVGLRPGEKLYEEVQHRSENLLETAHPRVRLLKNGESPAELGKWSQACVEQVERWSGQLDSNQLKLAIKQLIPEYNPHLD